MTRPRGGTLAFLSVVGLTGVAWAAGSHLRERFPDNVLRRQPLQLAQAKPDGTGMKRPGPTRSANPEGTLRVRPKLNDDTGYEPLDTFLQVYRLVQQNYVDNLPEERKLAHGAVRAMLADLNDPNSRFLEPDERVALDNEARGRFEGIGSALSVIGHKRDGYTEFKITVVAPLPGSPAQQAGVKAGDVVTKIDGKYVLGADPFVQANKILKRVQARDADEEELEKAVEVAQARIKNSITLGAAQKKLTLGKNQKLTLTLQRPGVLAPLTLEMTTALTEVAPVTAKALPGQVAYVKLAAFTETAPAAFKAALSNLPKQGGLILDLRGNPGGLLGPVKEIASQLTRGGTLYVEVGPGNKRKGFVLPAANRAARPTVVLVDPGTASSAEVLAGALRDKKIGVLVGTKTFGDALVQTLYPLPDGSAFTLTTGKLLPPGGKSWHRVGLAPDVVLASGMSEDQVLARALSVLKQRGQPALADGR